MKLSSKGAAFIRTHEGFVPRWYLDPVKVPTIGVGFTWGSTSFRVWWAKNKPGVPFAKGATITRSEADEALQYLVEHEYGVAVNKFLGKKVPQHVFDAMVSMVYNCGAGALNWKWAAAAKSGNYTLAASLLTNTAVTAKGVKLRGLVTRRKEEANLLLNGVYPGIKVGVPMDEVMRRGTRGVNVTKLQNDLKSLGFYDGKIDSIFGYGTEAAVMEFQRAQRLGADGIVGPATLAKIAKLMTPLDAPSVDIPTPPVVTRKDVPTPTATHPVPVPMPPFNSVKKSNKPWLLVATVVVGIVIAVVVFGIL